MKTTLFSLVILSIIMLSSLSWLVLRTLQEGREAIQDMKGDSKYR